MVGTTLFSTKNTLSQEDLVNESASVLPNREELCVMQGMSYCASMTVHCNTSYCQPQHCGGQYDQSNNNCNSRSWCN